MLSSLFQNLVNSGLFSLAHLGIYENEEWSHWEKHIIQALSRLGSGVRFLPNDPSELINRLLLLLGSKKAGNNNCFNETSAILDQLMNMKIINKCQYKDILSHIK